VADRLEAQEVAPFVRRKTEASRGVEPFEPEHRPSALLDCPMALLQQVISVAGERQQVGGGKNV